MPNLIKQIPAIEGAEPEKLIGPGSVPRALSPAGESFRSRAALRSDCL